MHLRHIASPVLLLGLSAAPGAAIAQVYSVPTPYCGGRLVAEQFSTVVAPGPQGRADY